MDKDEMKMIEEMGRFPIYAGCCIIGEDEIGIKKSELARLKNLEINYEQVYEEYRKLEQERKNCRLIADDEIVVKKYQLNETLNSTIESGRRMGYAQGRDETIAEVLEYIDDTIKWVRKIEEDNEGEDEDVRKGNIGVCIRN